MKKCEIHTTNTDNTTLMMDDFGPFSTEDLERFHFLQRLSYRSLKKLYKYGKKLQKELAEKEQEAGET